MNFNFNEIFFSSFRISLEKYWNARIVYKLSEYKRDGKDAIYFVQSPKTKTENIKRKNFLNLIPECWLQFIYLGFLFVLGIITRGAIIAIEKILKTSVSKRVSTMTEVNRWGIHIWTVSKVLRWLFNFCFGPKTKANYAWNHSYFSRTVPYTWTHCIRDSSWMNRCHLTHNLIHLTQPKDDFCWIGFLLRHRLPFYFPSLFICPFHFLSFFFTTDIYRHTFTTNDVTFGDFLCDTCVLITKTPCFIRYHGLFSIWMTIFETFFLPNVNMHRRSFSTNFQKNGWCFLNTLKLMVK